MELPGRLIYALVGRVRLVKVRIQKFFVLMLCKVIGVKVGSDCMFYGFPGIYRFYKSDIIIGNACRFRSAKWSNLIGVGRRCEINTIRKGAIIVIGDGCGLTGTVIASAKSIQLGSNVLCGSNVTITDSDWHGIHPSERNTIGEVAGVVIGNNVWLGLNVVVLKGVTIGDNSIVGAGSVVTHSIPANVIAAGQPARVVKALL